MLGFSLTQNSVAAPNGIQLSNCDTYWIDPQLEGNSVLFWALAASATGVSLFLILKPILSARATEGDDSDIAIYRDQLAELDRDLDRGLLDAAEAKTTRAEIARRLLAADAKGPSRAGRAPRTANGLAVAFVLVMVAIGSGATYVGTDRLLGWIGMPPAEVRDLQQASTVTVPLGDGAWRISPVFPGIGSPGLPDRPLADRDFAAERPTQEQYEAVVAEENAAEAITPSDRDAELLAQLRTVLEARPDDLQGYELLVQATTSIRQFGEAWRAQDRVVELKGDAATAEDLTNLAEFMIFAARGYISPKAEAALARALQQDPTDRRARYYSGATLAQNDQPEMAMRMWAGLLAEGGPFEPWKQPVREQMQELAQNTGIALPQSALSGPSAEDVEAAQGMDAEDRQAMIRGMVDGLAERLATEGGSAAEWARLITALGVLGDVDRAKAIAAEAQTVFAGQTDALDMINQAAAGLP